MKLKLKITFFTLLFLFFTVSLYTQKIGIDLFYCPNTLATSYIDDSEGNPIQLEIALNEKSNISNLNLFGTLRPNISFVGITTFPTNFSNVISTTFQLTDGTNLRDVKMTAKRINKRNAPFTISFTERFRPSDWIRATTGWTSIGVKDAESGNIELLDDDAVFFLAFNKGQELLSFDISGENLGAFEGVFSVETSSTGVDDWEPLFFIDNCYQNFKSDNYRIFLKINSESQYIRFSANQGDQRNPISINNFTVGPHQGENVENNTSISYLTGQNIMLKSNFVNNEISVLGIESYSKSQFIIYNILGQSMISGKINSESISVSELAPGTYLLQLSSNGHKTFKFIKY